MSWAGMIFRAKAGRLFREEGGSGGGSTLIAIGIKILVEHRVPKAVNP